MLEFVYCAKGKDHALMAVRSAETVKRHHPKSRIFIYTDQSYDVTCNELVYNRVRPDLFGHPWMLTNVVVQAEHALQMYSDTEMVVFLDNDIIMREQLELADANADMYVTWRDNVGALSDSQPYNYGVVILRNRPEAKRAMMWLEHRVSLLEPKHQKWYGNQIALRELVGPLRRNEVVKRSFQTFGVAIEQLPCSKYNWTPPDDKPKQSGSGKVFIHMKGDRKALFGYYYDKVMNDGGDKKRAGGADQGAGGGNRKAKGKGEISTG